MATRSVKGPAAKSPTKTVASYLAAAPADKRPTLNRLRRAIRAAAPKATEALSYGIVGYKHNGRPLVYFGYTKAHLAIYGSTGTFVATHAAELKRHEVTTSKGTIRFSADRPLPDPLVAKMVKARIAEIEAG